jgi:hypothetical protein
MKRIRFSITIKPSQVESATDETPRFNSEFIVGEIKGSQWDSEDQIIPAECKKLYGRHLTNIFDMAFDVLKSYGYEAEILIYFYNNFNNRLLAKRLENSELKNHLNNITSEIFKPVYDEIINCKSMWNIPIINPR